MDWYIKALNQYAVFFGRARRCEYWYFTLFVIIFSLICEGLDYVLGTSGIIGSVYSLLMFVPSLAVWVRRLHDIGRSGWWALITLIPFLGVIITLVWLCSDSQPGTNEYGANPKDKPNTIRVEA